MKRIFTLLAGFIFTTLAYSQDEGKATAELFGRIFEKGDNIAGFHTKFSSTTGKNKFEDDNTRKPSEFSYTLGSSWETMFNDNWAVGGFLEYDVDINKDKESEQKWTANTLVLGPMITGYKPCGEMENGGVFGRVMLGGGIMTESFTFNDDKEKDPVSGVLTARSM